MRAAHRSLFVGLGQFLSTLHSIRYMVGRAPPAPYSDPSTSNRLLEACPSSTDQPPTLHFASTTSPFRLLGLYPTGDSHDAVQERSFGVIRYFHMIHLPPRTRYPYARARNVRQHLLTSSSAAEGRKSSLYPGWEMLRITVLT